jgi:exodeoxyribonuclease-3
MSSLIASWNANGIRALLKKDDFSNWLNISKPAILCFQESKAQKGQYSFQENVAQQYSEYSYSAKKKGYSGLIVLTKHKPESIIYGTGNEDFDNEGRVLTLKFKKFTLVNVYRPSTSGQFEIRLPYRKLFDIDFTKYLKKLKQESPLIVCGDHNVALEDTDLANPKPNRDKAGCTVEEREAFQEMLNLGLYDSYKKFKKDKPEKYTYWNYRTGAREKNVGWRVDYICVDHSLDSYVTNSFIDDHIMGSDHCPIGIEVKNSLFE